MLELLWFLLPVAAASGWYLGRRSGGEPGAESSSINCGSNYIRGLNYVLNEQPDKAIEVFIQMLEIDNETVETHLALGNLFRRQGEVDRAIRIHQNLIARPNLSRDQRSQALLELGQDYMRAGLFDRAENLFQELIEIGSHGREALRQLMAIYQQEKEWNQAIETAQRLEPLSGESMGPLIAQFCCELAEQSIQGGHSDRALAQLTRAHTHDARCVRASMLKGRLAMERADYRAVIDILRQVEGQDADFLEVVLEPLEQAYRCLDDLPGFIQYLHDVWERRRNTAAMLRLADLIRHHHGEAEAAAFLSEHLPRRPSIQGIDYLIEFNLPAAHGQTRKSLLLLRELSQKLIGKRPVYKCGQCGFAGNSLHWQCPSCKSWGSVKPIQAVEPN